MAKETVHDKKRRSVLFVEDTEEFITNCIEFFENDTTLNFFFARNYAEAKSHLQNNIFDIAIIDLGLSEQKLGEPERFEGIQLVQELAALISPPIVIVSTAYPERARENPEFPKDFVLDIYDKLEEPLSKLGKDVDKARTTKRVQELLIYTSKYTSGNISIIDTLKKVLRDFHDLTFSSVCHLLLPTEDGKHLEIAVDTGNDEGRQVEIDNSVTGEVYRLGKSIKLNNTKIYQKYQAIYDLSGKKLEMQSELAVPLLEFIGSSSDQPRVIGVLNIECKLPDAYSDSVMKLMETFANFVVVTLQNYRRRQDLYDLAGATTSQLLESVVDLDKVIETALERGLRLINAHSGFIALKKDENLWIVAETPQPQSSRYETLDIYDSVSGLAVQRGYAINVSDVRQGEYKRFYKAVLGENKLSEIVVPFRLENQIIGVLNFESEKLNAFTSEDLRLLVALASQATVAIRITNQLQDKEKEARKAERSATVGDLTAGLTHNVNSPANGILFDISQIQDKFANLLQENPKLGTYLQRIEISAKKVLEVPKLIAEKTEQYKPAIPMTCSELILPKIKDLLLKKELIPNTVEIDIDGTIDNQKKIMAFEYYTPLVIENLVINAIEAMNKKGKIVISNRFGNDGTSVEILVDDNGPGVRKELRDIIFDRSYSKKEKGGIGLWWVKTHLERLGAAVYVENADIGGARFVLHFPILDDLSLKGV